MNAELPYYLAFARVKGIGAVRIRKLKAHFGSLQAAWVAGEFDLAASGLDARAIAALAQARRHIVPEQEVERLAGAGATALTWEDAGYPRLLREVADPPPVLFVKGALAEADAWAVSIVGTRRPTVYGREVAEMLAGELARHSITIVSGMARGIDAVAHAAALKAGGRTLAVLGCGVDVVYPPEHRKLAQQIAENGALISDYPLGTPPDALNFPPRNRIISGLSLGVVVVEADEHSGALITAEFAADQGRDVFAVPGNIFNRTSRGTNRLIQQGAHIALDAQSILEELNLNMVADRVEAGAAMPETDVERAIVARLSHEPTSVDELVRSLAMPAADVTATLALMELKGLVRQATGTSYVLVHEAPAAYTAVGDGDY
ncbi:MAG: DNA processing protein DprA [Candidatus Roseilinea sp.]|nr:MAG: DNA processing protein DprA [Candidatus Roseilinea sp.]